MAYARNKSLTEQRAEVMANEAGEGLTIEGRPYYMIGVMGSCAEEMELLLGRIASGEVRGREARMLSQGVLDGLRPKVARRAALAKAGA